MRENSSAAHPREHDLDMSYRASKDLASPVDRIMVTMAPDAWSHRPIAVIPLISRYDRLNT